jgi:hypothetical protein
VDFLLGLLIASETAQLLVMIARVEISRPPNMICEYALIESEQAAIASVFSLRRKRKS